MASTKQETLEKLLDEPHRLPLPVFAKLCSSGIPEGPSHALRARCWLLLLGVVDARQEKDTYDSQLKQSRENYYAVLEALSKDIDIFSPARSSQTAKQDKALLESAQDVDRTGYGLSFWSQLVPSDANALSGSPTARRCFGRLRVLRPARQKRYPPNNTPQNNTPRYRKRFSTTTADSSPTTFDSRASSPGGTDASSVDGEDTPDSRSDQLHRVLFFWALLNPAGYVQGMSELAAVLLFVFASSDLVEHTQHAEADTFAAFSRLLGGTGMIDIFSAIHDGPQLSSGAFQTAQGTGLGGVLSCLHARIALCDSPLAMHLQREGVQPSYFAIKWLTTLFAQCFDMATVLPLWDWLLSQIYSSPPTEDPSQLSPFMEAVIDLSTTFILGLADRLMDADFALCLGYLQSIECHMPSVVIAAAASLQEKRLTAPLTQHQQTAAVSNPLKQSLRDRLRAAAEGAAKQYASFSETDAAASLQKSATNWGIAALSLRDSIGTADRQDLTKRVQDLGSSLNRRVRPTSPNLDQPFQPPASPLHNESSPPTKYTSKLFNSRSSDSFDAPPSTPRTRPLLLGSSIRPSGSHSSLTPSFGSPADSRLGKSPMLSPSPKTHGRRTSSVSGGGLLGYVPSPGPSPSHPKFSHMTYRPSSPRTLMDSMPITENSLSGRSRQTSEPISPSASYQRLHQLTHADGDDPLRMSDQSADSSISPTISEEQVAASRRHAKRFSIPTRTIRSDSLADSFNPLTDQPSTSRQPQSAKPVFGLGIAETKDGLAPLQENEIASSPILQPPPKRKTKISSSRRRNQGSISSRASSTYSADTDSMSIRDEIDDGDAQEVLLPNKNNSSLSPATAKTADTGANSPGYDGIFDSYR